MYCVEHNTLEQEEEIREPSMQKKSFEDTQKESFDESQKKSSEESQKENSEESQKKIATPLKLKELSFEKSFVSCNLKNNMKLGKKRILKKYKDRKEMKQTSSMP
jgi:long-subunit acyl-CoA synthetase (AMP-forming)